MSLCRNNLSGRQEKGRGGDDMRRKDISRFPMVICLKIKYALNNRNEEIQKQKQEHGGFK